MLKYFIFFLLGSLGYIFLYKSKHYLKSKQSLHSFDKRNGINKCKRVAGEVQLLLSPATSIFNMSLTQPEYQACIFHTNPKVCGAKLVNFDSFVEDKTKFCSRESVWS